MTFKEFYHLEEKGMLSKALLGLSLLGGVNQLGAQPADLPLVQSMKKEISQQEVNILATTLILEAGGESDLTAMKAIFNVLHNRAKKSGSDEYDEALKPKQFSCWNPGEYDKMSKSNRVKMAQKHPKWMEAEEIVRKGLTNRLTDITGDATHYHVFQGKRKVSPDWTTPELGGTNKKAQLSKTIGNHVFLKNVD